MVDGERQPPLTDVTRKAIAQNLHAVETALHVICGKWKIMIIGRLHDGPQRFSELRRLIPLISQQSLVVQLRELEKDGVVTRHMYLEMPPRVEYSLTDIGRKISPVMPMLMSWGYDVLKARGEDQDGA